MNDIEILKEKIKNIKKYDTYRYDWTDLDIQKIENLIARNKELEEIEKEHKEENGKLREMLKKSEKEITDLQKSVEQIYADYQDAGLKMFEYKKALDDSISKSLLRHKIQELEYDQIENHKNICEDRIKIEAYKELLEE